MLTMSLSVYVCLCTYYSLFLNEHRLILLLTQAKAQVLCLLLSHWVGQWIKLLYVSTAALRLLVLSLPRRKTESLLLRSIVHMLASSYFPRTRQYREFSENEFSGNLNLLVSSSSLQPVENNLFWMFCSCCFSAFSRDCCCPFMWFLFLLCLPQAPLDHSSEMALSDSGFEPGGKRNFLQLTDKDGEQPQIASVSGTRLPKQAPNFLNSVLKIHIFCC